MTVYKKKSKTFKNHCTHKNEKKQQSYLQKGSSSICIEDTELSDRAPKGSIEVTNIPTDTIIPLQKPFLNKKSKEMGFDRHNKRSRYET